MPATERNDVYEENLSPQERDRYNRTRYGESAAEMAEYQRTGAYPKGRGRRTIYTVSGAIPAKFKGTEAFLGRLIPLLC